MQNRLDDLRGPAKAKRHNARTIAALTGNPGCSRRAVLDAAGVDKLKLADRLGFPGSFGQSRFALSRGNAFEAMLKADDCELLRSVLGASASLAYQDLGADSLGDRHAETERVLAHAHAALIDHPLLTLEVAGQTVYLEPDLVAYAHQGRLQVVEIKSFAIVDDQADSAKVSAAAVQAAVYVLALRDLLTRLGKDPDLVSHNVVLVCPENFSLNPKAVVLDVRKQMSTLRRQLSRLASVSSLIEALPPGVSFDVTLEPLHLVEALGHVEARYAPECLSACELSVYCRHEASGGTAALGRTVREALGGIESVEEVLALAEGRQEPTEEQAESAALLRAALRLRAEALS
ncbi:hypothetical protein AMIS_9170 [Actinoplanes missouriensis 431]|uniref:Secreted protein n=1 Tax=Actinoplanes missouriensis (strain ATCC 14538 / DSM 43046 / CBS 188.64 / JCM 3121 / NBRC 102363 / NCIMB 12654 / NRRL B-3342 / UNCC 431) TaxID=512565 RepID=I0GZF0_ACTM4|nr:hypothetical protein [Actinoplanes missouriensis]BAL86137.1 hypothetical protein AMIS_9170 [Actinoplanes missouriensis 431]